MHHHDDDTAVALPEGFLWGAATSPHQVEGGNVHSDWWFYETMPGGFLAEASGAACDSYHRWRDDMDLLARNGYNAYRFGIEWARIEPQPGVFDDEAIRHYGEMVIGAHERGLSAFVTLHHFSLPAWFAQAGGWGAPNAVDRFVAYVERIVPVLERGVAGIVTINEPNMVAIMSRVISGKASFGGDGSGLLPDPDPAVVDTLIAAHHAATAVLHRALPGVPIGWSVANQCVQSQEVVPDHADRYRESVEDRFIRPASHDDFIGVQSYTRTLFGPDGVPVHPPKDELTSNGWEYYPKRSPARLRMSMSLCRTCPSSSPRMAYRHGTMTDAPHTRARRWPASAIWWTPAFPSGATSIGRCSTTTNGAAGSPRSGWSPSIAPREPTRARRNHHWHGWASGRTEACSRHTRTDIRTDIRTEPASIRRGPTHMNE